MKRISDMQLFQDKLNVTQKNRSNLFNWRGQFTPQFVEYILTEFAEQGNLVVDPFSGSGTVLQEAARLDLRATGFEINPAAYAMSRFFTFCNIPYPDRFDFCNNFELKLNFQLSQLNGQKVYIENEDYRVAYANLLSFAKTLNQNISDKKERVLLLNLLFLSERDKGLSLKESVLKSFQYIKNAILGLPFTEQTINAFLKDSRCVSDDLESEVDLIFTSPPYINVFNYHQNFRAIVETFHFDILKVAHSEFGSNRKNRGNRFKTVIQYCLDMELATRSFWAALKPNAKLILVLGRESNVRGTPFYNGKMVIEILESCNGFSDIKTMERQFINKFGNNIKEDIIIATKSNALSDNLSGRSISLKHLEHGLRTTQNGVHSDIKDAIFNIEEVKPSPFFNSQQIITYGEHTTQRETFGGNQQSKI
ncbi:MAG TPA: DNA methyltransferase [Saprospiraceae bacterium]|nr:DNA methyltransferase [Saprospiraceae bacterium]